MKQTIRHVFEIDEDAFWAHVFFDESFLTRMYKEALGSISIVIHEDSGDTPAGRTRRLAFTQPFDAPGPIRKLFGETTTMEERGRFDPRTRRWTFEMIPDRMADKIAITGEVWLEPQGAGKIARVVSIEYAVNIFGLGGVLEKFMASATADSFEKQAQFTRANLPRASRE
jgi:hypothetical protein